MAQQFEAAVQKSWEEGKTPGAACIAVDKTGKQIYAKTFGNLSPAADSKPVDFDSVAWVASCTKLLAAISALQCVQAGHFTIDEPISRILPEFAAPDILDGFSDSGKPQLRKATKPITLRHLLTHSSGLGYQMMDPLLSRYADEVEGKAAGSDTQGATMEEKFVKVLRFEPGEGWMYSIGLDWAGKMVEKVSGMTLGQWMEQNIFKPLGGFTMTSFNPLGRPDMMERFMGRPFRGEDGKLTYAPLDGPAFPVEETKDDFGGSGLYSCAKDYAKVLVSILADDGKLLSSEMVKVLMRPALEEPKHFMEQVAGPFGHGFVPGIDRDPGATFDYALGGAIIVSGKEGQAGKGTMWWSGLPNTYWFIDRETGVAGVYVTQCYPFADPSTQELLHLFQKAVHAEATK